MSLHELENMSRAEKYVVVCKAHFNGHVYERRGNYYLRYWDAFPDWTNEDELFARDLYDWADRVDGKAKIDERDGSTVMECTRCNGIHEWLEPCPPPKLEPLDNNF